MLCLQKDSIRRTSTRRKELLHYSNQKREKMPERSKEQKLIDIMFEMVLVSTDDPVFCKRPRGERMAWVANQLRQCGFDTHPVGMSWGVLVDKDFREQFPVKTDNLDN